METALSTTVNPMTTNDQICEVCGGRDAVEIPEAAHYTGGHPIHVCCGCGFVYYRERRTAQAIADSWSEELFGAADGGEGRRGELNDGAMVKYSALTPYAKARQTFVLEMVAQSIGLEGRNLCDIGAGQGTFLEMARDGYGATVFGIEPSADNCVRMREADIACFEGIAESYLALNEQRFDVATITWALENCESCRSMIDVAYQALNTNGHIVVATGSRILVPFKKPLQYYFNSEIPQDAHPFYFSYNCLNGLLAECGFRTVHVNRYIDSDYLVLIAEKINRSKPIAWERDDYQEVLDFFRRWDKETRDHYPN